jgi:hypothetical protein
VAKATLAKGLRAYLQALFDHGLGRYSSQFVWERVRLVAENEHVRAILPEQYSRERTEGRNACVFNARAGRGVRRNIRLHLEHLLRGQQIEQEGCNFACFTKKDNQSKQCQGTTLSGGDTSTAKNQSRAWQTFRGKRACVNDEYECGTILDHVEELWP